MLSTRTVGYVRFDMREACRQIRKHDPGYQTRGTFGGTDGVALGFQEITSSC